MSLATFLRGLRILRHPELVRRLGEMRSAELEIEELRRRNPGARISSDAIIDSWREGEEHKCESKISDGTEVCLEVSQRGPKCCGVDQGRQEEEEDDVGIEFDTRKVGHKGKSQPT